MKKTFTALAVLAVMYVVAGCGKEDFEVEATGVRMRGSLVLDAGETFRLSAEVIPDNVTRNVELIWESSDSGIVTVDGEGGLTPVGCGEAVITVRLKSKPGISADCRVTVDEEVVTIEDDKLFALLLNFDTNGDGRLQKSEAEVVRELDVTGNGIRSMKGIEYFTSLEKLNCSRNLLTSLDVSANTALKELECFSNMIESLDVGMLSHLEVLDCHANRLQAVDVAENKELVKLNCGMNDGGMSDHRGIRKVDVTQNPKLEYLDVYYTNLSEIDVTQNPRLRYLNIGHSCHTNWDLTPIARVDLSRNPELEHFNCMSSNVRDSDIPFGFDFDFGMEEVDVTHNPKLKRLITYGNPKVKKIDLGNNPELIYLNVSWNGLAELDISKCPKIDTLSCHWNQLTALDLTKSEELIYLDCANNRIGFLDFSNTKLGCLLANGNRISRIDMGGRTFDTVHKPVGGSGATGIDNKPYLYMKLNDNLIEEIDLSKQTYLHWLEIKNNRLTVLDVGNCVKLGGLLCSGNNLRSLNIRGCERMWELHCENNSLTGTLDVSGTGSGYGLSKMSAENNGLDYIKVWKNFNPESSYFFEGKTHRCYTKDAATEWL